MAATSDRRQLRHPAELHRRLRARRPPHVAQLAPHDRHRRRPAALPRRRRAARHAGDAALARPARPPRRRAPGARPHHRRRRRPRRAPPPGDRVVRQGERDEAAAVLRRRRRRRRSVNGRVARHPGPADAGGAARAVRHPRPAVLPAGVGRGGDGAVRAAGVQPRRRDVGARVARRHRPPRRHQDRLHRRAALPRRPPRPPPDAALQRGRHGRVAPRPRLLPAHVVVFRLRLRVVGGGDERGGGGGVHGDVLAGVRAGDMDVRVGDPAAAAAGAGHGNRDGGEPGDERGGGDELHLAVRGGGHGRHVLPLRGVLRGGVGVRLRLPPGDQGEEPRGDGEALRRRPPILAAAGVVIDHARAGRRGFVWSSPSSPATAPPASS